MEQMSVLDCWRCGLKHLSGARTTLEELFNGYGADNDHLVKWIGDMYHAECHVGSHTDLAKDIRMVRTHVEDLFIEKLLQFMSTNDEEAASIKARMQAFTNTVIAKIEGDAQFAVSAGVEAKVERVALVPPVLEGTHG